MTPVTLQPAISLLPAELLRSVLQLLVTVSNSTFTSPRTRFGNKVQSSAQYLHVSKSWLEAGTPLLYQTVVLRSAAQVCSLRSTLVTYPDLGLYVRNLRIEEGAYYAGIQEIVERTPRVEVLVLSLVLYRAVNPSYLCRALAFLDPRKVVLHDLGSTIIRNSSMDKVVKTLCRMMIDSQSLESFEWHVQWRSKVFTIPRTGYFADALIKAPRLHSIAISGSRNTGIPALIGKLLDKSIAERICIVDCPVRMKRKIRAGISRKPGAQERVIFIDTFNELMDIRGNLEGLSSVFQLPKSSSRLPDSILKRIVHLALSSFDMMNENMYSDGVDETQFYTFETVIRNFELVSKLFKSFSRPFKFLQVSITDFYCGMQFLQDLLSEPISEIPPYISSVYVTSYPRSVIGAEKEARDIFLNALCSMTHLTELSIPARPADIRLLARYLGGTLMKFDIYLDSDARADDEIIGGGEVLVPNDFEGFQSLEVLWLRCSGVIPVIEELKRDECNTSISDDASVGVKFERLRTLTIQDYEDGRVFKLISQWNLSTVKRLSLAGSLYKRARTEVDFVYNVIASVLENGQVETLVLGHGGVDPDIEILSRALSINKVKKLEICFSHETAVIHQKTHIIPVFTRLRTEVESIPKDSRKLENVHIRSLFKWPYTHNELRKSIWPKCIDTLVRDHNISVTNYKGVPWRPRLTLPR
ncbi:uncharacterized protein FOMMEDRAFT_159781 [Fomitiporia mediterranea MF3/22]|uniref:uncharacterized protein n=1 Tax=Fomitiporia mediterranea (strain MF3/22) TaxID=694068 RepID=UPI0004408A5D|nr:uncharacterized protein FOMMEDRAFT_159781 [Fomitiporia mediterranea MF3/22]EJD00139.1 hypothetical protein FOMMEDRAFT_159781 [Fomitiporia mediterranea MF3/22]